MDMYKSTYDGSKIDLDDIDIYPKHWKEMNTYQLWNEGWTKAGRSIFYMTYIYPELRKDPQWERVHKLCHEFMILWKVVGEDTEKNRHTFIKWLYRFNDEVENQC